MSNAAFPNSLSTRLSLRARVLLNLARGPMTLDELTEALPDPRKQLQNVLYRCRSAGHASHDEETGKWVLESTPSST